MADKPKTKGMRAEVGKSLKTLPTISGVGERLV
jgi:hypothetical protein